MMPMATMWCNYSLQRKVLRRWAWVTAVIWRMEALPAMDSWIKTEIMLGPNPNETSDDGWEEESYE